MNLRYFGWLPIVFLAVGLSSCDSGAVAPILDFAGNGQADTIEADNTVVDDPGERPDGATCTPGETQCVGTNFLECTEDGSDWIVTICERGTMCTSTGCEEAVCAPNSVACDDDGRMVVCKADGSGFGAPIDCPDGYECIGGQCLTSTCTPGSKECTPTSILSCEGEPPTWVEIPCATNEICFKGECVDCFTDTQCTAPMTCIDGHCITPPLAIVTQELPVGQIQTAYATALEATGGMPPYIWSLASGSLPTGLALAADGTLAGTPTVEGNFDIRVAAQDDKGLTVQKDFELTILPEGLTITSKSPLPDAEEGTEYSYAFQAIGGIQPYGWNIRAGAIPVGMTMSSEGVLTGIPAAHGNFDFTVRVVDDADPVASDSKDFSLTVKIAPLEIIGDQMLDLFLTKAVVLPMITVVEGIPIPYNTDLKAKGGVKPYTWSEIEIPGLLKTFIPKAGIPQGLTLSSNGRLSGSVTDTSSVFELKIPFMDFTLTGFFFMGEVRDAQDPADSDQAIFLIPTIPVNLGF